MSRHHFYLAFLLLFVGLFFSMCGKKEPGGIYGIVTDQQSGQPVIGAEVILSVPSFKTVTNDSGYYELSNIEPKDYTIFYIAPDYDTVRVEATEMKKGERYQIDVALIPGSSE